MSLKDQIRQKLALGKIIKFTAHGCQNILPLLRRCALSKCEWWPEEVSLLVLNPCLSEIF